MTRSAVLTVKIATVVMVSGRGIATVPTCFSDAVRQTRSATPELPFHLPDLRDDFGIGQGRDIAGVFVVRDGREDTAHDLAGTRLRHVRHDHDMAGASNRSNLADHRVLYTLAELVA